MPAKYIWLPRRLERESASNVATAGLLSSITRLHLVRTRASPFIAGYDDQTEGVPGRVAGPAHVQLRRRAQVSHYCVLAIASSCDWRNGSAAAEGSGLPGWNRALSGHALLSSGIHRRAMRRPQTRVLQVGRGASMSIESAIHAPILRCELQAVQRLDGRRDRRRELRAG